MAQQERGRKSKRSILEAAARVFDERGYDAASTNDILARTGLTRGSMYHHFPSKEAIALALLDAHGEALTVIDHPVKVQSVIDLTLAFAERLLHDAVLRASLRLTIERTSLPCPPQTAYEQSTRTILALLRQAQEQGEILPGTDLPEAAETIVGSFTGLQIMSQAYTGREDLADRVTAFWRFMLPGLVTPGLIGRLRITPPPVVPPVADAD